MWQQWPHKLLILHSSSQSQSSYIIWNPQQRRISQSQPVRGRDEEQDDIVSADVEEVVVIVLIVVEETLLFGREEVSLIVVYYHYMCLLLTFRVLLCVLICGCMC